MPIINTDKQLRERDPHDFYPTPDALCAAALSHYADGQPPRTVLDPGAGEGPWGRAVRRYYRHSTPLLTGVDLYATAPALGYDAWVVADFLTWPAPEHYALICGNPPYKHAERFVRRSWDLLTPGGTLIFLLRLAFLEGQARGCGLWRDLPPAHVGVLQQRPSFTGNGKTDATAYALFHWVKGWTGGATRLDWIDWKAAPTSRQLTLLEAVS